MKHFELFYIAGNPETRSKVTSDSANPMTKKKAIEAAERLSGNGWRCWVVNARTNERVFESGTEITYQGKSVSEFKSAKKKLIDNAVGFNEYENITTWDELQKAACFEHEQASFRASQLDEVVNAASYAVEDN
ncbi:hypothetical protein [Vibrio sonorensis]|uniref:hypothetical protein n=1 Tax=Vibrio sonorensis TaxID=1004316 RepID=UPI0008DA039E|nr:hypothetical protein [Vibrio sonorensis]